MTSSPASGPTGDISSLTLNRLSLYVRCLRDLAEEGVETISSQELADRYNLSATQIRKDLAHMGELGIRGVGYDVESLKGRINGLLGLDRTHPIVIVGMGNLGNALAHFLNFRDQSFRVVAAVDNDDAKIGEPVGDVRIESSERIAEVVRRTGAEVGVLTVPRKAAQKNYEALVDAGIKGILNFAPVRLEQIGDVPIKTVDLRVYLEELGFLLQQAAGDAD